MKIVGILDLKKSHIILNDNLSNSLDMKRNNIYNPADPVRYIDTKTNIFLRMGQK